MLARRFCRLIPTFGHRKISTKLQVRRQLQPLYNQLKLSHKNDYIGEPVTQLEHFVLAAQSAEKYHPHDLELITGTFLHDIGHQSHHQMKDPESHHQMKDPESHHQMKDPETGALLGLHHHDEIGAQYLKQLGFSHKVVAVVRNHVISKRFMATVSQRYLANLSPASQKTFELQGGLLTPVEMETFKKDMYFKDSLLVRSYDNSGKDRTQLLMPIDQSLEYYFDLVCECLFKYQIMK